MGHYDHLSRLKKAIDPDLVLFDRVDTVFFVSELFYIPGCTILGYEIEQRPQLSFTGGRQSRKELFKLGSSVVHDSENRKSRSSGDELRDHTQIVNSQVNSCQIICRHPW